MLMWKFIRRRRTSSRTRSADRAVCWMLHHRRLAKPPTCIVTMTLCSSNNSDPWANSQSCWKIACNLFMTFSVCTSFNSESAGHIQCPMVLWHSRITPPVVIKS